MRKLIPLAVITTLLGCTAPAIATPTVRYQNKTLDFPSPNGTNAAALVVNAGKHDSCLNPRTDEVHVRLGAKRFPLFPCVGNAPNFALAGFVAHNEYASDKQLGDELGFVPDRLKKNYAYSYPLVIRYQGRTLLNATVRASAYWLSGDRIYEGTDAFVNICIDGNYVVHSSNLRLYCFQPGIGMATATISRNRS